LEVKERRQESISFEIKPSRTLILCYMRPALLCSQLFKIGARIRETARCIRIHLASGWPFQDLFQAVCNSS